MSKKYLLVIGIFMPVILWCQVPQKLTSGQIYMRLEKLGFLGSVLYVAAHPDDENTRLISYMANEKKAQTTYLSLTRGDGGQNLIGSEIDELLGVMRTQELLMARSVDNGKQMFSRANDFGFSKNAEETIEIWDTDKVKADVVWAIRKTRPDVIINRFDHRTSGKTHGHHTASAILAHEMFDFSDNPSIYPEQLKFTSPWKARRIFFNTSWWHYGSEENFNKADKSSFMSIDVGTFFPHLGKSNTEIAAESRSMHKCQGFGSTGTRGTQLEYLELLKGDLPPSKQDIFEGINTSWTRVQGGDKVKTLLDEVIRNYDFRNPSASVKGLITVYNSIMQVGDNHWKNIKAQECIDLIFACSGLFAEAKSNTHMAVSGENIQIDFEVIRRMPAQMILKKIESTFLNIDTTLSVALNENEVFKLTKDILIPQNTNTTAPYWLTEEGSMGMYKVGRQEWIGMPETPKQTRVKFVFDIDGEELSWEKEIIFKFNSPENGETYRPFEIVTPVSVKIKDQVYIFPGDEPQKVIVSVKSYRKNVSGTLTLPCPKGWKVTPEKWEFTINEKGNSKEFIFNVTPPSKQEELLVSPMANVDGKNYDNELIEINYDHIPFQIVQQKSISKWCKIGIKTTSGKIAFYPGAGDQTAENLRQIGYQVDIIGSADLNIEKLSGYDALVFGIRAFNVDESLKFSKNTLLSYMEQGGNVIVQYNTSSGLVTKELGPFPFTVSRERVTVEQAKMQFLNPDHPVLNYPNKITDKDFEGWVQERGLYFVKDIDPAYEAVFSCHDPGEAPLTGALITATYGKGSFIYTGLSFFRQLPAGVSGAFRLFANMIALNQSEKP